MRTTFASILILAAALAGCGGKSKSTMSDPCKDKMMKGEGHEEGMEGMEAEHEEHAMTAEMTEFHDVLAPLWHAEAGPQRTDDTCAASGHMLDLGAGIQNAAQPEGVDATAWTEGVQTLLIAVTHLQDACPQVPGGVLFEDAFSDVHDAFHGLLDLMPKAE